MILNFIDCITLNDFNCLKIKSVPFIVIAACVFVAIIVDLISGVRRAYLSGTLKGSTGYRKTVDKVLKYYSVLILMFMMDIIKSIITPGCYFSCIAGIGIVIIELISWYENLTNKQQKDIIKATEIIREGKILEKTK